PTRAEKDVEELAQTEVTNSILVQLTRLVVECRHAHARRPASDCLPQPPDYLETFGPRRAEAEHESLEFLPREVALPPEYGEIEILLERDLPRLARADRLLVTILKVLAVERELLNGNGTLFTIPPIGAEHAADV